MKNRSYPSNVFIPFTLFLIFTTMAIISVLFASRVYYSTVRHADENFEINTPVRYVSEKIRQYDRTGNIDTINIEGKDILVLCDPAYDSVTYIYEYEGKLMELFADPEMAFSFKAGSEIMDLKGFTVKRTGSLLSMTFKDSTGNITEDFRAIRSERSAQ